MNRYELAGLGVGPFRVAGCVDLPSTSLGEKNPDAYARLVREAYDEVRRFGVRLGTCDYCGMGLRTNVIIADSRGAFFVLGSECATKIGGSVLGDEARIAVARAKREAARKARAEAAAAKREERLSVRDLRTGESVRDRLMREERERAGREVMLRAERRALISRLTPFADVLCDGRGGFCDSVAEGLLKGDLPRGRGIEIALDVFGKRFGRRGSKAFTAAWNRFACALGAREYMRGE